MPQNTKEANEQSALEMVDLFVASGADRFDVTLTNANGELIRYRPNLTTEDVKHKIPYSINQAIENRHNIIIRPRNHAKTIFFVQLDDLSTDKLEKVEYARFLTIETSPNNFQSWIAISKAERTDEKEIARVLRRISGADTSASGATRLAGTRNFKDKYAPDYPIVAINSSNNGLIVSEQDLKDMGLLANAAAAINTPASPTPSRTPRPILKTSYQPEKQPKRFPDYGRCLDNAPANSEGTGQDTSRADFTWCMIAIDWGWSVEETATQLLKERFDDHKKNRNSEHYATLTARNAESAVNKRGARGR
ncbi:DNA-primase RepB domain-containing protein [uncultured Nostoc sp.]|uniref:DNA-primase RepB domain-containing protein n=1 Tax=uncultured Nostoc sp. TaxID=340711 RepID=UPI0035CB81F2